MFLKQDFPRKRNIFCFFVACGSVSDPRNKTPGVGGRGEGAANYRESGGGRGPVRKWRQLIIKRQRSDVDAALPSGLLDIISA